MIDFLMISTRSKKNGVIEIYPKFIIPTSRKSNDLMIRGGDFHAIWLEDKGFWSTNEGDALHLIDQELDLYFEKHKNEFNANVKVLHMWDAESGMIDAWHKYCQKQLRDSYHNLDEKIIFSNTNVKKRDYASKRLEYPLEQGEHKAFDRIMSVLYSEEERHKIEWAIGSIVNGDSKKIQKFMVLYGSGGTGKSTVLNIIKLLFDGYCATFDAKSIGSASSVFALEAFKNNPLVAINYDGDLSRIEDNTRLNSLVAHETLMVNEKFKSTYSNSFKCFLFIGSNKPVKITDAKSGLIRRLIDVSPTGKTLSQKEYDSLMAQIPFELGAIAWHCQEVYEEDPGRYNNYVPSAMLTATNDFFNYILDSFPVFEKEDGVSLKQAWEMYKTYCDDAKVPYPYPRKQFQEELKSYFKTFKDRTTNEDGVRIRNYYSGFIADKFMNKKEEEKKEPKSYTIIFEEQESIFDKECSDCPAQYASTAEKPTMSWAKVRTKLQDLDTKSLHYVKVPLNHIVIDFDLKDKDGNKCFDLNLKEASKLPPTYAELSKGGQGIHLHYIYTGDPSKLSSVYATDIEVKVFTGNSSLRRKLTKCNNLPIATIGSGLPLKEEKVVNSSTIKNEKGLRNMIERNLRKEIHGATKPSVDFIYKILEDAYNSGMHYDVSDMASRIIYFASQSSHQAPACLKLANQMKFKSEDRSEPVDSEQPLMIFYDVEVFPNLFLVCYKVAGESKPVVSMFNPTPTEIEDLLKFRLVGFNNRRYDNHMLYARLMGFTEKEIYILSDRIISGDKDMFFGEAFNLSYTDVYDFSSKKQSLKKFEIELGIHHQELGLPWDEPVPEEMWDKVAMYCKNDVIATEAVFNARHADFVAREVLADVAGGTVNDTTNSLTTKIIFGKEKHPNLVYTDLSETFPGYEFIQGKDGKMHNMYRGVDVGFGGYIFSNPGMYGSVALLDVASMHPSSIIAMNCFGDYTARFKELLDARIAIKHKDFDAARKMLGGKLEKYLTDESAAKDLAQALKIAINSVYGLTAASFDNPFRDIRNKNNIVALRGALFMKTLQDEVESRGFKIVAIKTDSIKIADATPYIIKFCIDFAQQYGYTFEHEATYDRICQVNDADYIAKEGDEWTVTGKKFAVPYVFKKLFSKEEIVFEDLCETKEVKQGDIYIDMNEDLADVSRAEKELDKLETQYKHGKLSDTTFESEGQRLTAEIATGHNYIFVGRVGQFCPIKEGCGGGLLYRKKNNKYYAISGSKGYRWLESEMVKTLEKEGDIDEGYYISLVDDAKDEISKYGDFERFVAEEPFSVPVPDFMNIPEDMDEEVPF